MKDVTIASALDEFLEERKPPRVKQRTFDFEKQHLEEMLAAVGTQPLKAKRHTTDFLAEEIARRIQVWINKEARRIGPATLKWKISNISRFFKFCERRRYLAYNPIQFTTRPRLLRKVPPVFTFEEYERIKQATLGSMYYWFTICSYRTGMSMVDVCLLKWESVDMDNLVITIMRRKLLHTGAGATTVPFLPGSDIHICLQEFKDNPVDHWPGPEYVCAELASWWTANRINISQRYTMILRRLGITGKSAMHWRHTFISAIANSGMATSIGCKMSGHSNPATLARYIRPDVEVMRSGIIKANEFMERGKVKIYEANKTELPTGQTGGGKG